MNTMSSLGKMLAVAGLSISCSYAQANMYDDRLSMAPASLAMLTDTVESNHLNVHGQVQNEEGFPAKNITVTLKGTNVATRTDENGEFSLSLINREGILLFRGPRVESFEFGVNGHRELVVNLKRKPVFSRRR